MSEHDSLRGLWNRLKNVFPHRGGSKTDQELAEILENNEADRKAYIEKMIQKQETFAREDFFTREQIDYRLKKGILLPRDEQVEQLMYFLGPLGESHLTEMKRNNYPLDYEGYIRYAHDKARSWKEKGGGELKKLDKEKDGK